MLYLGGNEMLNNEKFHKILDELSNKLSDYSGPDDWIHIIMQVSLFILNKSILNMKHSSAISMVMKEKGSISPFATTNLAL